MRQLSTQCGRWPAGAARCHPAGDVDFCMFGRSSVFIDGIRIRYFEALSAEFGHHLLSHSAWRIVILIRQGHDVCERACREVRAAQMLQFGRQVESVGVLLVPLDEHSGAFAMRQDDLLAMAGRSRS